MKRLRINKVLKQNHLKNTKKRQVIIDVLLANGDRIMSVEEIYQKVKVQLSGVNLTTVYRNLETLYKLDLLLKTIGDDQSTYYKISCDNDHHHHHFICQQCGATKVLEHCPMEAVKQEAAAHNFKVSGHKFEIYGLCDKCETKS